MKVCPVCGYPNPDDAVYCARCGYRFPTPNQQPSAPQAGYSQPPPNPPPYIPQQSPPPGFSLTPEEIDGLRKIKNFGLFNMAGIIVAVAGLVALLPSLSYTFGTTATPGATSLTPGDLGLLTGLALVVIAGIIGLVSFFYLLSGYSSLRRVDREFDLPYYGLWLEVVATVIGTLAALGVFIAAFGTGDVGLVVSMLGVYVIAGIIGLVGYVLGYIIGPFRLDNRYREGDFKVAGIMYILAIFIGFLIVVGVIFMYLGAKKVLERAGVS